MIRGFAYVSCLLLWGLNETAAQCTGGISSFPYTESFEASNGGWTSGGAGNDWAWGTPNKSVIRGAGGGTNCWITGGLTGSSYTSAEASWLQSPCFDFSTLRYPFISFKINWETEQQFDGASFQYSIDNGGSWITIGPANYTDCAQKNWFNQDPVTYLSPLTSERRGWSGNSLPSAGSCRGGNGSNGWVTAQTIAPGLAARPGVLFRFIFGAGTICNDYDGFAVDDIYIGEMPPLTASFDFSCMETRTVRFTNTSENCLTITNWNFGDPASGTANTSISPNPTHTFSGPGKYTVTLTASAPGIPPAIITRDITIINATVSMLNMADCQANNNGSLMVSVEGTTAPLAIAWNTNPVQTTTVATNLAAGSYMVTVSGTGVCPVTTEGRVETDYSCNGVHFPSAFTPNNDGKNEGFGPLGSLAAISNYKLRIYNRWGERVFHSVNPFQKWDGKLNGYAVPGNIYAWFAEFDLPGLGKQFRKGTVVLIK